MNDVQDPNFAVTPTGSAAPPGHQDPAGGAPRIPLNAVYVIVKGTAIVGVAGQLDRG